MDITDADTDSTNPDDTTLSFLANPDQFICEGFPVLDASGNLIFDPTEFISDNGLPVSRERCNFTPGWDANNFGSTKVIAQDGTSFVSQGCKNGEIGPLRDCGFSTRSIQMASCIPGQSVRLSCKSDYSPQVLRVCERSEALGGVDCTFRDSLANGIVNPSGATLSFACPAVRDPSVAGTGGYSVYRAPLLPSSPSEAVSCTNF